MHNYIQLGMKAINIINFDLTRKKIYKDFVFNLHSL